MDHHYVDKVPAYGMTSNGACEADGPVHKKKDEKWHAEDESPDVVQNVRRGQLGEEPQSIRDPGNCYHDWCRQNWEAATNRPTGRISPAQFGWTRDQGRQQGWDGTQELLAELARDARRTKPASTTRKASSNSMAIQLTAHFSR